MIEIYLLEALKAFSDTGTLSAASERLHLAEPSVSRAMKKPEGILGVSLFERGKNSSQTDHGTSSCHDGHLFG